MDGHEGSHARDPRSWALGVTVALVAASTFAPWLRSGAAVRDSYGVVRAADRLGVVDGWGRTVLVWTWPFVPFAAALALLALVGGWDRSAAALAATVGIAVGVAALQVVRSPQPPGWGTVTGLALAPILIVQAAAAVRDPRSNR